MPFVTTFDGTEIFYKDWGSGPPVLLAHGWRSTATAGRPRLCSWPSTGFE